MSKIHALLKAAIALSFFYSGLVFSNCDCGNTNPLSPCTGNIITHISGGKTFTWEFNCGDTACSCGQFINGDYWVAPSVSNQSVTITAVSPVGIENGLVKNPMDNTKHGLLSCEANHYDATLNLMNSLPVEITSPSSLVKADRREEACGTKSTLGCCVDSYDVLTILDEVPISNGSNIFRPAFASTNKRLFSSDDFDYSLIPSESKVSASRHQANFSDIVARWNTPYVDHYMQGHGDSGRRFAPAAVLPDYGAELGGLYISDLISIMGSESPYDKKMPANALIQRGIDLYGSLSAGISWPSGAGQQVGRKQPLAFFASLVRDADIKREIMALAEAGKNRTQVDGQIRVISHYDGGGNIPVWGDEQGCGEDIYWSQLFFAQNYYGASHSQIGTGDNKRTCADPYGWIDGPAGMPGDAYMSCCSTGVYNGYVLAQYIMPELCKIANDPEILEYVNRVKETGVHTQPDSCAPPDPKESTACLPYKAGHPGCLYYGKTWGPNPEQPGKCIKNGTNGTIQSGRYPHLHGRKISVLNQPLIVDELWDYYYSSRPNLFCE